MPVNKNALLRYHVLDKCFRNTKRRYFLEDLMCAVNEVFGEKVRVISPERLKDRIRERMENARNIYF